MVKTTGRNIDLDRRAEIGAERRSRTRSAILQAALELMGRAHGRETRIEDVCAKARIARGTFYNHFTGMEELLESLSDELTRDFDAAVHAAFEIIDTPVQRTCAAILYYLHGAVLDPRWGWAMVNSSVGTTLYSEEISSRVRETIQEGIDQGDFTVENAEVGRDILLGSGVAATISLLQGNMPSDYPEKIARHLLLSLGVPAAFARKVSSRPLDKLPRISTKSHFFRGTIGDVDLSASGTSVSGKSGSSSRKKKKRTGAKYSSGTKNRTQKPGTAG